MQSDRDVFSPELVLVCPELRPAAIGHDAVHSPWLGLDTGAGGAGPPPATTARARSRTPRLATALAVCALLSASGFAVASSLRAPVEKPYLAPPGPVGESAPVPGPATTRPRGLVPAAVTTVSTLARATSKNPQLSRAPTAATTGRRSKSDPPRVTLSPDGIYVKDLDGAECPGAPAPPWLLVAPNGSFRWSGELAGYRVAISGRVDERRRVRATATYRGRGCARTTRYTGTARAG